MGPLRPLRVLGVGDSHLGFDHPVRPRVSRRRRGPDFLANLDRALEPARRGAVDLVIHGGDLFHLSRPPAPIVEAGLACLLRVAERGVPVFLVPGNHERSRIPRPLLGRHALLHVFDEPRTFRWEAAGLRLALAGFPFTREVGGQAFASLLEATAWRQEHADIRLLCLHQAVAGAKVGVHDYRFRPGRDVIDGAAIPWGLAAVVSGHIHRHQVLTRDLGGAPLAAPVLFPGSVERTSFQERGEPKGYLLLDFVPGPGGGRLHRTRFVRLPTRPMITRALDVAGASPDELEARVSRVLAPLPEDAVLRLEPHGLPGPEAAARLTAATLRRLAPATMNVDLPYRLAPRVAHAAR